MKERPIVLNIVEVRAALKGRLKQIWRPMMPQPHRLRSGVWVWRETKWCEGGALISDRAPVDMCPYGQAGDNLWVKEDWDYGLGPDGESEIILYKASHPNWTNKWYPSVSMPRSASRLTLEVVDVRVKRVQDISEEDAIAAGISWEICPMHQTVDDIAHTMRSVSAIAHIDYRGGFRKIWDQFNAKRGFGWDKNPWVWVVEVKRIEKEEVRDER